MINRVVGAVANVFIQASVSVLIVALTSPNETHSPDSKRLISGCSTVCSKLPWRQVVSHHKFLDKQNIYQWTQVERVCMAAVETFGSFLRRCFRWLWFNCPLDYDRSVLLVEAATFRLIISYAWVSSNVKNDNGWLIRNQNHSKYSKNNASTCRLIICWCWQIYPADSFPQRTIYSSQIYWKLQFIERTQKGQITRIHVARSFYSVHGTFLGRRPIVSLWLFFASGLVKAERVLKY